MYNTCVPPELLCRENGSMSVPEENFQNPGLYPELKCVLSV